MSGRYATKGASDHGYVECEKCVNERSVCDKRERQTAGMWNVRNMRNVKMWKCGNDEILNEGCGSKEWLVRQAKP